MRSSLPRIAAPCLGALLACTAVARADDDLTGSWVTGATSMKAAVESWGKDCGPRPQSSSSPGGHTVQVEPTGRQLVIHSGQREIRSDRCWSRNPAMRRDSSSYLDNQWTTVCRTPPDDPREETGTYTLKALTADKILYRDVSRYNWKLNESACVATITTTQTMTRVRAPGQAPAAAAPTRAAAAERCTPGPAARLSLSPRDSVVELGAEQCYRARLVDARGCALPGGVKLTLHHPDGIRGELRGKCFKASDSAAEGEGRFTVQATGGGFTARATVEVKALDLSGLIAQRIDGVSAEGDQEARSEALPAPPAPEQKAKVAARAETDSGGGSLLPIVAGAVALLLVGVGLLAMRRRGPTPAADDDDDDDAWPAPAPATPPEQAQAPAAGAIEAQATPSARPAEQWICPNCRRGYPAGDGKCTHCPPGQNALVPYSEFVARGREQRHAKRCADCGAKWDTPVNFCGDCGSRNLVDA